MHEVKLVAEAFAAFEAASHASPMARNCPVSAPGVISTVLPSLRTFSTASSIWPESQSGPFPAHARMGPESSPVPVHLIDDTDLYVVLPTLTGGFLDGGSSHRFRRLASREAQSAR